jgi:hypothetical protein
LPGNVSASQRSQSHLCRGQRDWRKEKEKEKEKKVGRISYFDVNVNGMLPFHIFSGL